MLDGTVIGTAGGGTLPDRLYPHPDHWGKGLAHEAMRAVIDHAFATQPVDPLMADVDPRNDASIRLLTKLGFTSAVTPTTPSALPVNRSTATITGWIDPRTGGVHVHERLLPESSEAPGSSRPSPLGRPHLQRIDKRNCRSLCTINQGVQPPRRPPEVVRCPLVRL